MRSPPVLFLSLAACTDKEPPPPNLMDTGWFGPDTTDPDNRPECDERVVTTVPEADESDWYWRDRPVVYVEGDDPTAFQGWIEDAAGARIDGELVWDDTNTSFRLEWDGWLAASTDYVLYVEDCQSTTEVPFRTSALGLPLGIDPADLVGRTWLLDLNGATWIEPGALGAVIAAFFTTPVLLGVNYADDTRIDLVGALGFVDSFGSIQQDTSAETWDFPMADFTGAPFVDAEAPSIELVYSAPTGDAVVPVTDFVLQATFSADGERIGGGVLSGVGDSRYLGAVLGDPDNQAALCDLAAGLGVQCQPCGDGEPYCLRLEARDLEGEILPGLQIRPR